MRDWVDGWKVSGGEKEIPDKELLTKPVKDLPMQSFPQQKNIKCHCFI